MVWTGRGFMAILLALINIPGLVGSVKVVFWIGLA